MFTQFISLLFRRSNPRSACRSLASLTPREKQIAGLWYHSNKQISRQLYITPETVRCHWKNIYARLGVHSKIEVGQLIAKEKAHGQADTTQP